MKPELERHVPDGRTSEQVDTGPTDEGSARPKLIAFRPAAGLLPKVVPAPRWRRWMNETRDRWANRCLPLVIANESGWMLLNPYAFEAVWNGGPEPSGLTIRFDEDIAHPHPIQSHFGYGVIMWAVPYLFRTPPGFNLLARGPSNWPKDGVCALEGIVETDWSVATFTMNWKMTRPDHPVRFEVDDPFCMIVPQHRGELERFHPVIRDLDSEPETKAATKAWVESRHESQVRKYLAAFTSAADEERVAWQGHYFRGTAPDGTEASEHQKRRKLAEFELEA